MEARNGFFFDGLPDDLIVKILDKLLFDAKWLCRCSVVSKRFEAIIFNRIHRVSFPLSGPILQSFFPVVEPKFESFAASINLSRFPGTRYLHLHLPNLHYGVDLFPQFTLPTDLIKWCVDFGTKMDCFAFLAGTDHPHDGIQLIRALADSMFEEARLRLRLVAAVAKTHPMLESVSLTDEKKYGAEIFLAGQSLVALREKPFGDLCKPPSKLKALELDLPDPAIHTRVKLVILRPPGGGGHCSSSAAAAQVMGCFQREDNFVRQAVAAILAEQMDALIELAC